jgi:hypothetical protein
MKITGEYLAKNLAAKIGGTKWQEKLANAYTVLCNKTNKQTDIF